MEGPSYDAGPPAVLASMLPSLISRVATRIPLKTLLKLVGIVSARPRPREVRVAAVPAGAVTRSEVTIAR